MTHVHSEKCKTYLGSLSDYIDGELREELCRELERHLAGCEDCRVVVDTTRKTIYLVHECADSDAPCPEDVRERLFKRLNLDDLVSKVKKE
jgi:anti-sigma factor (TIGR02949 family)